MTETVNEDFVGLHHDDGGNWLFTVLGEIEYISDYLDRFEDIIGEMFAAWEGFIRPIEIEYSVQTYSGDGPIEKIHPTKETADVELQSVERETVIDENGLTASDIPFGSYGRQDETVQCIGEIELIRAQVYLELNGYEGWLDRTDERYIKPARFGEAFDKPAKRDPIGGRFHHASPGTVVTDPRSVFLLSIGSTTDLWFEETPIGRANRQRLEAFFARLYDQINISDVTLSPEYAASDLQAILPDEPEFRTDVT